MALNLKKTVINFLKNNKTKTYTAKDIAIWITENYVNECQEKINNTTLNNMEDCVNQLRAEICAIRENLIKSGISMTAERPRKYYYTENFSNIEKNEIIKFRKNNQPEKELYPILSEFCNSISIKTLRIDEKCSNKTKGKNYNKWLHADVVGFQDLVTGFNTQTKDCLIEYSDERSYLFSFEVKDGIINPTELREYFFQTVSNSSWANYSYLVAEGINDSIMDELQLLCSSFKIGFIKLDKSEPTESEIVIKAPKTSLDWNMINRIANKNPDFQKYLENITLSYKRHSNSDFKEPKWDLN